MRRIRYSDLPPEERARFDALRSTPPRTPTREEEIRWAMWEAIQGIGYAIRARDPRSERWARWRLLIHRAALLRWKADQLIEQADELLDIENEVQRIDRNN